MFLTQLKKLVLISLILNFTFSYGAILTRKKRVSSSFSDTEKGMTAAIFGEFSKRGVDTKKLFKSKKVKEVVEVKKMIEVPETYTVTEKKELGRGASIVERQKAKVRAQLAAKRGEKTMTGKEKIQAMLRKNREKVKQKQAQKNRAKDMQNMDIYELARENERQLIAEKRKMDRQLEAWATEYEKNLKKWAKAREEFLKRIPEVKANLEDLSATKYVPVTKTITTTKTRMVKKEVTERKEVDREVTTQVPEGIHYVAGALDVAIKDQKRRPTCSSFSGLRAVEILMMQNGVDADLSEQYFYWSSKPKCRTSPCTSGGSWVGWGYDYSIDQSYPDIPTEKDCPYVATSKSGNQTQIPLGSSCNRGFVKIVDYEYVRDLDSVANALRNDFPVVASIKLTENFYNNEGLVFQSEIPSKFGSKDEHAGGHSVLLVGLMQLPPKLKQKEGSVCFLTANSWGIGWGKGGYACLSEKWMRRQMRTNPFVILKKVSMR